MKSIRIRFFGLLTVLFLTGLIVTHSYANDVPFPPRQIIDDSFDGASSVATGDLDGDGDLDLVGAAYDENTIAWWENSGSTWSKQVIDNAFGGANDVHLADLNGDGNFDVLGAAFTADTISWWQKSGGTWNEHLINATFDGAWKVSSGDIDGDGDLDVLGAAWNEDAIVWWENNSGNALSWTEHVVDGAFNQASSVIAADMDFDGDLDILGTANIDDDLVWWENTNSDGDGSTWNEHLIDGQLDGATSAIALDLDGDSDLDVLASAANADYMGWWENTDGNGLSWVEHSIEQFFDGAWQVHAADLDHDGDLDILGVAQFGDEVTWWEKSPNGLIEHSLDDQFDGARSIITGDLDADGDLDILGAARYGNLIAWWENKTPHVSVTYPFEATIDDQVQQAASVTAGDVDHDGHIDVVGAAFQGDQMILWKNSPDGWIVETVAPSFDGAKSVEMADVDGDGDLDVIGAAFYANKIAWWENSAGDGSSWIEHLVDQNFGGANSVHAADLDQDGDLDLLGAAFLDNEIAWWENISGDGSSWTKETITASFNGARAVYSADIDRDGDLDVLAAAETTGQITWWENLLDGEGDPWFEHLIANNFSVAYSVYAADIDQNGYVDVLAAGASGIRWWANDGTPTNGAWSEHQVDNSFNGAKSVYAADLDHDGDLDILGASHDHDEITWWENRSSGLTWQTHPISDTFEGAHDVYPADLDRDGDLDILGAAWNSHQITWWENQPGQFALATSDTAPTSLQPGQQTDMLKIVATHLGRSDDDDMELVEFVLKFEKDVGDPLTNTQANALIENLSIYLDSNQSDAFEAGSDTLVTTIGTLALTDGVQLVPFTNDDPNVQIEVGTPRTYFVVVQLTANAGSQPPTQFRVTHQTAPENDTISQAQLRDNNYALTMAYAADVSSSLMEVLPPPTPTPTPTKTPTQTATSTATPTITPAATPSHITFRGTILLDGRTLDTHQGTLVTLESAGKKWQVDTDSDGRFSFTNIPRGDYTVRLTHPYFLSYWKSLPIFENDIIFTITLCAGDIDADNDIKKSDWNQLAAKIIPTDDPDYDLNQNGQTDIGDLIILSRNMGRHAPADCASEETRMRDTTD